MESDSEISKQIYAVAELAARQSNSNPEQIVDKLLNFLNQGGHSRELLKNLLQSNTQTEETISDEFPNLQFLQAMEGHVRKAMGVDDVFGRAVVINNKEAIMASKGMLGHVDTRFV